MITHKTINIIICIVIFSFSLLIALPIVIFSNILSPYSIIDESVPLYYNPNDSSFLEKLNINADIGEIKIEYINEPVSYYAKVNIWIEMIGSGLSGQSYLDYFNIVWRNATTYVNLTIELKNDANIAKVLSLIRKVNIIIALRADVICDISIKVNIEGNVKIVVPFGRSIGNIITNISKGIIQYDFTYSNVTGNIIGMIQKEGNIIYNFLYCSIKGNITGIVNYGDISLLSDNNQYNHYNKLTLINEIGLILIEIVQYEEIGSNITGTGITKTGIIHLIYEDNSPNIGAQFILYNKTSHGAEGVNSWIGFERDYLPLMAGQYFYSKDFPTQNNYNFSLFKWDGGDYLWNLYSIPT